MLFDLLGKRQKTPKVTATFNRYALWSALEGGYLSSESIGDDWKQHVVDATLFLTRDDAITHADITYEYYDTRDDMSHAETYAFENPGPHWKQRAATGVEVFRFSITMYQDGSCRITMKGRVWKKGDKK